MFDETIAEKNEKGAFNQVSALSIWVRGKIFLLQ
jgi:hypothetical protein